MKFRHNVAHNTVSLTRAWTQIVRSSQPWLPLIFPVQESGLQVCAEGSFNSWAVPSDRASFILTSRVSRRHESCYEIRQGKKILIRVQSPGSQARINRARHEIIEISLIQKNAISQRLKGITSLKINIFPLIFWSVSNSWYDHLKKLLEPRVQLRCRHYTTWQALDSRRQINH